METLMRDKYTDNGIEAPGPLVSVCSDCAKQNVPLDGEGRCKACAKAVIEQNPNISDGSEYPEGQLLRPCEQCGKLIPYGASFHYEECPAIA